MVHHHCWQQGNKETFFSYVRILPLQILHFVMNFWSMKKCAQIFFFSVYKTRDEIRKSRFKFIQSWNNNYWVWGIQSNTYIENYSKFSSYKTPRKNTVSAISLKNNYTQFQQGNMKYITNYSIMIVLVSLLEQNIFRTYSTWNTVEEKKT